MLLPNYAKMIVLLVDQQISYRNLTECSNMSKTTNAYIFSFGHDLLKAAPEVHTYMVIDLNSAVEAVMNYYK